MQRFLLSFVVLSLFTGNAWAQNYAASGSNPSNTAPATAPLPDQPVAPQVPTLERRPLPNAPGQVNQVPVAQMPPPILREPFQLTPQEDTWLDQVLTLWEKESQKIKTFECKFKRWEYYPDLARSKADAENAAHVDYGLIKYATPDKGRYETIYTNAANGKDDPKPIEENRAELYICDGKAVYKYEPAQKRVHEIQLPPALQGKAIVDTPLPFIFGAEAKKLRQRYWMKIITPDNVKNQIWIIAYPRYQEEAANFQHTLLILETPKLTPMALKMVFPGGKNYASYQFYDLSINDKNPLKIFQNNPFVGYTPRGWQKEVHPAQSASAPKPPPGLR
jgi:TIGR03009 family protein